jgi:FG-GAP-like repeat
LGNGVGDFNGDGQPDLLIVATDNYQDYLAVYLNDGTGAFNVSISTPSGEAPYSFQNAIAEDFNGDGKTDVLVRIYNQLAFRESGIKLFTATPTRENSLS